jgi:phytoene synthase
VALIHERYHFAMRAKTQPDVKQGFQTARRMTRHYAKSFYFASLFLQGEDRRACYAIYALCRLSDNAVDDTQMNQRERLDQMKNKISAAYSTQDISTDPLLACFQDTVRKYHVPQTYFDELLDGMDMDLRISRYPTFQELHTYCYKVAGVVGLIMLKIFGMPDPPPEAEQYAVDLGVAMQLTNILRDIKEDLGRDRIYLPQDELKKYAISEQALRKETVDEAWTHLLRFQIERARSYYAKADRGLPYLKPHSRLVVALMGRIYAEILREIELLNYNIFVKRASVSRPKKCLIALKTYCNRP